MKIPLRLLRKSPGFTVVALVTLALGIGVSTTAFTVLNRLLLQPLPFHDPDRLVKIWATSAQAPELAVSPGVYCDLREQSVSIETVAAFYLNFQASLAETGKPPERTTSMPVSADFLPLVGVQPMLGRAFTVEEQTRGDGVIILSNAFWQRRFGGDRQVLGRTLRLDGKPVTVIGVMPPRLDDPMLFGGEVNFWFLDNVDVNRNLRGMGWYQVAARLKPGVSLAQAQAEIKAFGERLARDYPQTNSELGLRVVKYPTDSVGDVGGSLAWLVMALSLAVLLIACVNLANLQLVRTTGRSREIAIRLAVGASRLQLVRLLLGESLLLALAGGALGLLVAKWATLYLSSYLNFDLPFEFRVIAFALLAALLTGALFGTMPALLASRTDVNKGLKQSGPNASADRSRHRLRHTLVVAELVLTLTLLAGAGYFVRGLQRMTSRELGWSPDRVLVGLFSLSHDRFGGDRDERSRLFAERFQAELQAVPGVSHATVARSLPLFGFGGHFKFKLDGQEVLAPGGDLQGFAEVVSPGYFATFGMHLLQGRDFAETDRPGTPLVAIVNQSFVKKFCAGESPLGKRINTSDSATQQRESYEIVGVVNDIGWVFDQNPAELHPQVYRPFAQNSQRFLSFALRGATDVTALSEGARQALAKLEPDFAITFIGPATDIQMGQVGVFAAVRRILLEIAGIGLVLSAVGIYGVIANLAVERTHEVGIRMALGASPGDVRWLFLRSGLRLSLLGTVIGLTTASGLMIVLNRTLAIVPGNDPWVVVAVATLLALVALFACWLPARRATKVNPIIALRAE